MTPVPDETRPNGADRGDTCHLLIVEDSDTQAMRLRYYFEAQGWVVTRAASGSEARAVLSGKEIHPSGTPSPFDLVLLDYNLPDTRGDDLLRELRAEETDTQHLPVLLLTASEEEDIELRGLKSGADDYVSKSASIEVLLARLQSLLQKSRAHTELSNRYEREHRVAQMLQESLLSAAPSDAFSGLSVHMAYEPAWDEAQIGGDFYDIRAIGPDTAAFLVGDVVGKGLQAATFTAEVKYALRAFLYRDSEPGSAIACLNDFLVEHSDRNPWANNAMIAVCAAVCNGRTGRVRMALGGAEPPLVLRRDPATGRVTSEEISITGGMMLGILSGQEFQTAEVVLNSGDMMLLFTDGITEARQRRGELLGYEGVAAVACQALEAAGSMGDAAAVVTAIVEAARLISGGHLLDDACLIAVLKQ